jgi:CheY-like chemotaxis protein
VPSDSVWVVGDPTRLHQILANLLGNGLKFNERGGSLAVHLAADRERGRAVLTVRDTGIGIDADTLPFVFDVFTQADRTLARTRGGLGLGLALVKGLVALHGGEVSATSEGLGQGATFTMELPLAPEPRGAAFPSAGPASEAPMRVLVVDDNPDMADTFRILLELVGCAVAVAYTGPDAVVTAQQFQPQVVFCDLGLPGMDGFGVARALRADPATASMRLIAVSGYGDVEHQRRTLDAGFDAHLIKPVEFSAIEPHLQASR